MTLLTSSLGKFLLLAPFVSDYRQRRSISLDARLTRISFRYFSIRTGLQLLCLGTSRGLLLLFLLSRPFPLTFFKSKFCPRHSQPLFISLVRSILTFLRSFSFTKTECVPVHGSKPFQRLSCSNSGMIFIFIDQPVRSVLIFLHS